MTIQTLTATSLADIKAASTGVISIVYDRSVWTWTLGNFTGQADDVNIIKADSTALTAGAWVRQNALIPNLVRDGRDNAAVLTALLTANIGKTVTIPAGNPLVLASTVTIPAGTSLLLPQGVAVIWTGANSDPAHPTGVIGVFKLSNGSSLSVNGPEGATASVSCAADKHKVYAVICRSVTDWRVTGIFGERCNHVDTNAITPAGAIAQYADVVTPLMKANGDTRAVNVNLRFKIYGGGCRFDSNGGVNDAGAALANIQDGEVAGATWTNAGHGCVTVGGNADPNGNGAVGNERKSANVRVNHCYAFGSSVGGIWAAMTKNYNVVNSEVANCGDVGFDSEGCIDATFNGNKATDCRGGNFTTFYLNEGVQFQNNISIVTDKTNPHLKIYENSGAGQNGAVTWEGGRIETRDTTGVGSVSTDSGPCRYFTIKGAFLINTVIRADKQNLNQVRIEDNELYFPYRNPTVFQAIRVFGINSTPASPARPKAVVARNTIHSAVSQPTLTNNISVSIGSRDTPPNAPPLAIVEANNTWMPTGASATVIDAHASMYLEHNGDNSGIVSRLGAYANRQLGPIFKHDASVPGIFDADGNRDENGVIINLTRV